MNTETRNRSYTDNIDLLLQYKGQDISFDRRSEGGKTWTREEGLINWNTLVLLQEKKIKNILILLDVADLEQLIDEVVECSCYIDDDWTTVNRVVDQELIQGIKDGLIVEVSLSNTWTTKFFKWLRGVLNKNFQQHLGNFE